VKEGGVELRKVEQRRCHQEGGKCTWENSTWGLFLLEFGGNWYLPVPWDVKVGRKKKEVR